MDKDVNLENLLDHFEHLSDPRRDHPTTVHPLESILVITVLAVICGSKNWVQIEQWAKPRKDWLEKFLELPGGIPSHDTLGRVFQMLEAGQFRRCFARWARGLARLHDDLIALDGKTLRGSVDGDEEPIHVINAWSSVNDLVMAQLKVDDDSNEIPALKRTLRLVDVQHSMVTVDAIGCQTDIAQKIVQKGGDYLLRVRGNQEKLMDQIRGYFEWALDEDQPADQTAEYVHHRSVDGGHGRVEVRECWCSEQLSGLEATQPWAEANAVMLVRTERHVDGERQTQTKCYITSEAAETVRDAEYLLGCSRDHWEVENKVHWVLDVAMQEDRNRARKGDAAQNLSMVRKLAMNLLRQEDSLGVGLETKQIRAAGDRDYLLKVLESA